MSKDEKPFKRQLFGYRRRAVDEHLAAVDASIADLREVIERTAEPEHNDLVLRATRLAVEDILQRAHDDALRIRDEAEAEASRLLADAYDIVAARESVIDLRSEAVADDGAAPASDGAAVPDAVEAGVSTPADVDWQADLSRAIDD